MFGTELLINRFFTSTTETISGANPSLESGLVNQNDYLFRIEGQRNKIVTSDNIRAFLNDATNQKIIDDFFNYLTTYTISQGREDEFREIYYNDKKLADIFNDYYQKSVQEATASTPYYITQRLQNIPSANTYYETINVYDNNFVFLSATVYPNSPNPLYLEKIPVHLHGNDRTYNFRDEYQCFYSGESYYIPIVLYRDTHNINRLKFDFCDNVIKKDLNTFTPYVNPLDAIITTNNGWPIIYPHLSYENYSRFAYDLTSAGTVFLTGLLALSKQGTIYRDKTPQNIELRIKNISNQSDIDTVVNDININYGETIIHKSIENPENSSEVVHMFYKENIRLDLFVPCASTLSQYTYYLPTIPISGYPYHEAVDIIANHRPLNIWDIHDDQGNQNFILYDEIKKLPEDSFIKSPEQCFVDLNMSYNENETWINYTSTINFEYANYSIEEIQSVAVRILFDRPAVGGGHVTVGFDYVNLNDARFSSSIPAGLPTNPPSNQKIKTFIINEGDEEIIINISAARNFIIGDNGYLIMSIINSSSNIEIGTIPQSVLEIIDVTVLRTIHLEQNYTIILDGQSQQMVAEEDNTNELYIYRIKKPRTQNQLVSKIIISASLDSPSEFGGEYETLNYILTDGSGNFLVPESTNNFTWQQGENTKTITFNALFEANPNQQTYYLELVGPLNKQVYWKAQIIVETGLVQVERFVYFDLGRVYIQRGYDTTFRLSIDRNNTNNNSDHEKFQDLSNLYSNCNDITNQQYQPEKFGLKVYNEGSIDVIIDTGDIYSIDAGSSNMISEKGLRQYPTNGHNSLDGLILKLPANDVMIYDLNSGTYGYTKAKYKLSFFCNYINGACNSESDWKENWYDSGSIIGGSSGLDAYEDSYAYSHRRYAISYLGATRTNYFAPAVDTLLISISQGCKDYFNRATYDSHMYHNIRVNGTACVSPNQSGGGGSDGMKFETSQAPNTCTNVPIPFQYLGS